MKRSGRNMNHRAFSLIEMLVATALASVLMYAVLLVAANLSRDRKMLTQMNSDPPQPVVDLLRWDISNADTASQRADGQVLILIGHGGVDRATLLPNGRLAQITYRITNRPVTGTLVRQQEYLDDPVRPDAWQELVAAGATDIAIRPASGDVSYVSNTDPFSPQDASPQRQPRTTMRLPSRVRLHIDMKPMGVDEELWIK
jgi:prepilin-type N-terminal cleavage/methylation domain-containing protein